MSDSTTDYTTEFSGRRALVTGGSRGIGAAIARRLLDSGAQVITTARSQADETPAGSTFIAADIRTKDGARELVERSVEALGGLDLLFNNAGAARAYPTGAATIPDEEWQDSLDINFLSAVRTTDAALPALRESSDAAIVNISSGAALKAIPAALHYASAKAAMLVFSEGMAQELAPAGIRVNSITPGPVETPGGTEVLQSIVDAMGVTIEAVTSTIPLGHRGAPEDIAEMAAFLASKRAGWITGANFSVDGGS